MLGVSMSRQSIYVFTIGFSQGQDFHVATENSRTWDVPCHDIVHYVAMVLRVRQSVGRVATHPGRS